MTENEQYKRCRERNIKYFKRTEIAWKIGFAIFSCGFTILLEPWLD